MKISDKKRDFLIQEIKNKKEEKFEKIIDDSYKKQSTREWKSSIEEIQFDEK